jgi:phage-related protein
MNLLDLMIKVGIDDQATSGLDKIVDNAKTAGQNIGNALKTAFDVGTKITTVTAGAMAALTTASVNSYADYEQLVGGVETLFKDSAEIVKDYADNAFFNAGASANKYMEMATGFSAILIQNLAGDTAAAAELANTAIEDMSDNSNKFGTRLETVQRTYESLSRGAYMMLDNLKLGYGGTMGEMARLLNDANKIDSTILGAGVELATSGKNILEGIGFDQVIRAIHVIQENIGITGTTVQEAERTITGSATMVKAAWSDMLTAMANENADFGSALDKLTYSVGAAFANLIPRIEQSLMGIAQFVEQVAPVAIEAIPGIVESVLPSMLSALEAVGTAAVGAVREIAGDLVTSISDVFYEFTGIDLAPLIDSITLAITTLQEAFSGIMEKVDWETVTTVINGALTKIAGAITAVVTATKGEAFQKFVGTIKDFFNSMKGGIETILTSASEGIRKLFAALTGGDLGLIQSIADAFGSFAKWFEGNLATAIETAAGAIVDLLEPFAEGVGTLITEIGDALGGVFKYATEEKAGPLQRIADSFKKLVDAFKPDLSEVIDNVAKAIGNLFTELGKGIVEKFESFANALERGDGFLQNMITHAGDVAVKISEFVLELTNSESTVEEKLGKLGEVFGTAFSTIKTDLTDAVEAIKTKFTEIISAIENFDLSAAVDGFVKKVQGAIETIKGWWDALKNGAEKGYEEQETRDAARAHNTQEVTRQNSLIGTSEAALANLIIQGATNGSGAGTDQNQTIVFQIDGAQFARVVLPGLQNAAKQQGLPVRG